MNNYDTGAMLDRITQLDAELEKATFNLHEAWAENRSLLDRAVSAEAALNTRADLPARVAELEAQIELLIPFAKMGDWAINDLFSHMDLEASEVFDAAQDNGLLLPIEGGFNPEIHSDEYGCSEPGDPWYNKAVLTLPTELN